MSTITSAGYIDSFATKSNGTASTLKGLNDNFDQFLTLLTTQMKNQDPMQPMDTNQMTEQLVAFTNVEQNIATNSRLDKLLKLQESGAASTNLAYLGRLVTFEGDKFQYTEGMKSAPLGYELETEAKSVRVDILDSQGRLVRSMTGQTAAGTKHTVDWDFKDDAGRAVQPGEYRLNIAPKGATEADLIKSKSYSFGVVNGIGGGSGSNPETSVIVANQEVPMGKILSIY